MLKEQEKMFLQGGPGVYKVVKTGPSGHNIRSCPNLRGIPIGMLVLGNRVKALGEVWIHESVLLQVPINTLEQMLQNWCLLKLLHSIIEDIWYWYNFFIKIGIVAFGCLTNGGSFYTMLTKVANLLVHTLPLSYIFSNDSTWSVALIFFHFF